MEWLLTAGFRISGSHRRSGTERAVVIVAWLHVLGSPLPGAGSSRAFQFTARGTLLVQATGRV